MSSPLLADVQQQIAVVGAELARRTLMGFIKHINPSYEVNWHHRLVAQQLDDVLDGKIRRLMIFEPPQNGKSEQVSRNFPAYVFGKQPDKKIIAASYADSLAEDMGRDVQKIMTSREYRMLFPDTRLGQAKDAEKRTQAQFDIVGRKGSYIGKGINSGLTGKTSHIGIIDDPIKNREEAESEVYRDKVWENYKSAFATRQFGDEGAIILCQTRWHEDDLAGRLLKLAKENPDSDQWIVITLPAICDVIRVYDPRKIGEPLWPKKYPLRELKKRKILSGEYDWAALYQQEPAPAGGGLFKKEWFADKFVGASPRIARRVRGWDTAATDKGGDYTVGVKISEGIAENPTTGERTPAGLFYIENVVRDQLSPKGVDDLMKLTAQLDGVDCAQREEKEPGGSGVTVIAARTKLLVGYDFKEMPTSGSKITRSKPFRSQCEAGNVFIVRTGHSDQDAWIEAYLDELSKFPTGNHDDQVDASSCAFNAVLLEPVPEEEFVTW